MCVALEAVFNVSEKSFCGGAPALMNEGKHPCMTSIFYHAPHYSESMSSMDRGREARRGDLAAQQRALQRETSGSEI